MFKVGSEEQGYKHLEIGNNQTKEPKPQKVISSCIQGKGGMDRGLFDYNPCYIILFFNDVNILF